MRKFTESIHAAVDLGVVLMIGIAFAGMMVGAYIIFKVKDSLLPTTPGATTTTLYNNTWNQVANITTGFDNAINLILVAITIFILAVAISALMVLRGRRG
jgi:large-conductance mechanosensitive channel